MTGIVVAFFVGAAFGAYGVVFFAKRATVQAMVPDRPAPDYYGYLQSRGRIEDPHSRPYGDA